MEKIRLDTGITEVDGLQILVLAGEIDIYTAPQFREAVDSILNSGQKHLIIDMSQVSYMDSSGFGTLLSATKRLRPSGGTVTLVNVGRAIERILKITRLDTIFQSFDSVEAAVLSAKAN